VSLGKLASRILPALLLAVLIHLDWHWARPQHHQGHGWAQHWLAAIPVFAILAWRIYRAGPKSVLVTSAAVILGAAFLAQVVEPAGELLLGAPRSWAFGMERLRAFALYLGTGIATHISTLAILRAREAKSESAAL
jgi:hypothetical protein